MAKMIVDWQVIQMKHHSKILMLRNFFVSCLVAKEFLDILGDFELAKSYSQMHSELFDNEEQTPEHQGEKQRQRLVFAEERAKAHEERINKLSANLLFKIINIY